MGDRRDSNAQPPLPQRGALPLSYGHHEIKSFSYCGLNNDNFYKAILNC